LQDWAIQTGTGPPFTFDTVTPTARGDEHAFRPIGIFDKLFIRRLGKYRTCMILASVPVVIPAKTGNQCLTIFLAGMHTQK